MRQIVQTLSVVFVLAGVPVAVAAPPPVAATADQPGNTPSGATFTIPRLWFSEKGATSVVVRPPEADLHIVIVDVGAAKDAGDAVTQAWTTYSPAVHRTPKLVTPRPARDGWDERKVFDYETSPNEHLAVQAIASRSGTHWTVVIVDGSEGTLEKRGAAASLVFQSLRPAGYHRETFIGRAAHPLDAARIGALKSFVQTAMQQLGVPGVGLAFVDHGKVVYEGGLGVRELGKPEPVDAHTLFMIASNTKGMSTLLLAKMVDAGKLRWGEPVTEAYPAFRLGSDATTKKVLIRNLVCACTGLPRKDLDWILNTTRTTPATVTFDQLAATEPTSGFGEVFQYNNLMASAAGYIGGQLVNPGEELGAAYNAAMQKEIFDPLGMRETTFDFSRALAGDHASPHGDDIDGKPSLGSMDFNYSVIPYRPAGGAWSSAHDMIKYVQNEIAEGKLPDGTQFVSGKNLLQRRQPNVSTGEDGYYGMGLEGDTAWGVTVIHHGGSMAGYKSDIMLIPSAGVGAVILTNADNGRSMLRPFMRRLLEVLYDGKPEAAEDVAAQAARIHAEIATERKRLVFPADAAIVAGLAADYTNPDLGHIAVRHDGTDTVFDFGLWKSRVASRKNDDGTVSIITVDPTDDGFEFVIATRVGQRALTIRDGQHEYVYTAAS
jgi:CubicO group peptidase (beta-lactamase class C family)